MVDDDKLENNAGDAKKEFYFLVSASKLREKKGASIVVSVDICTVIGLDCERPEDTYLSGDVGCFF